MSEQRPGALRIGARAWLPFGERGERALVRLLALPRRDLLRDGRLAPEFAPYADAVLVDVSVDGRAVLPGAWADISVLRDGEPASSAVVARRELRFPAAVVGTGAHSALLWGETLWPLPLTGEVAVPDVFRPGIHRPADLRRLLLAALGRRSEVALALWQDPGFEVPWHDVRLHQRARWWFDVAQIGSERTYRQAAAERGVPVEGLAGTWT